MRPWPAFVSIRNGKYFAVTNLTDAFGDVGDRACHFYNLGKLALDDKRPVEARALFEECASALVMETSGLLRVPGSPEQRTNEIPQYIATYDNIYCSWRIAMSGSSKQEQEAVRS